jgi:hypothetical protein
MFAESREINIAAIEYRLVILAREFLLAGKNLGPRYR